MKRQAKLFSERQRQVAQEEELKIFSECTFHPDVHEAPKYVKRIAKSMKVLKAARNEAEKPPGRPKKRKKRSVCGAQEKRKKRSYLPWAQAGFPCLLFSDSNISSPR